MQSIWAAQPNALLAWLQDNEPDAIDRAEWVLTAKDYIRFKLTGEIHAEMTDFSGTSLMNLQTRQYDRELMEDFGIGEMLDLLPPLVQTADICGHITSEAAKATGLKAGTPVAGGMFDIDACGLASGLLNCVPSVPQLADSRPAEDVWPKSLPHILCLTFNYEFAGSVRMSQ